LRPLPEETEAWVRTGNESLPGKITSAAATPRSYHIEIENGERLQNCAHLNFKANNSSSSTIIFRNPYNLNYNRAQAKPNYD